MSREFTTQINDYEYIGDSLTTINSNFETLDSTCQEISSFYALGSAGVAKVLPGTNIQLNPSNGIGIVTISLTSAPDTAVRPLTGNWENTYTTVFNNSASWGVDSTLDTGVRALTSNWESTYITVSALSASWSSGGGLTTVVQNGSANWNSTYATVSTLSANWNSGGSIGSYLSSNNITLSTTVVLGDLTVNGTLSSLSSVSITQVIVVSSSTLGLQITGDASFTGGAVLSSGQDLLQVFVPRTTLNAVTGNWESTYTTVNTNSSNWITQNSNVSALSLSAAGRITSNEILTNNLSALGDITYINTVVKVVSSVTVENFGTGPALLVQQYGNQPAARFVDQDSNVPFAIENDGKVVIGDTTTSSQILTIHGGLSSRDAINVSGSTSNNWQSTYTTVQSNSGSWGSSSGTSAILTGGNFNAGSGLRYLANTLSNIVTALLPTSPTSGTVIYFEDPFNYWNTQNFVVSANYKIGGVFQPLNCNINNAAFYLTFISELTGWKVKII